MYPALQGVPASSRGWAARFKLGTTGHNSKTGKLVRVSGHH